MSGVGAVRGAWRGACRLLGGPKKSAGLTPKMKTRVDARLLVAPRGATCWYGSTHASYGVRFSSTNHLNSPELTQTGSMNSVPEIDVGGGLSPPRQLQIEQTGAGSTTACTSPRTRWRSSRARCRSGPSFLASFEARVCVSASACLLCVSASAWLRLRGCVCVAVWEGSVAVRVVCRVLRPLRTPGRPRAGAVARVPFGRCHIHALRATWTSASRFEVRGRRVCLWLRPLYCLSLCVFYVCLLTY